MNLSIRSKNDPLPVWPGMNAPLVSGEFTHCVVLQKGPVTGQTALGFNIQTQFGNIYAEMTHDLACSMVAALKEAREGWNPDQATAPPPPPPLAPEPAPEIIPQPEPVADSAKVQSAQPEPELTEGALPPTPPPPPIEPHDPFPEIPATAPPKRRMRSKPGIAGAVMP